MPPPKAEPGAAVPAVGIPPKPPRPFTEYHVFFQLERNYILQNSDGPPGGPSVAADPTACFEDVDPHAAARPPRYRSLVLPRGWHTKGSRPKRRSRRKAHGRISFLEMTKLVSRRWKEADAVTRAYCREVAERELKRYREEMREYVEQHGEGALRAAREARTHKGGGKKKEGRKKQAEGRQGRGGEKPEAEWTTGGGTNETPKEAVEMVNEDAMVRKNLNFLSKSKNQGPTGGRGEAVSLGGATGMPTDVTREELLIQENLNLLLRNQAAMLALEGQAKIQAEFSRLQRARAAEAEALRRLELERQREQIRRGQAELDRQRALLEFEMRAMAPRGRYETRPEAPMDPGPPRGPTGSLGLTFQDLPFQALPFQAQDQGWPEAAPPVNANERIFGDPYRNDRGNGMTPRMNQDTRGIDSYRFIRGDQGKERRMLTMTTIKDQGRLPPLFEEEEYRGDLGDVAVDSPQGGGKFEDFGSFGELPAGGNASFDDCSIVGPMGICPESPTIGPLSLKARALEASPVASPRSLKPRALEASPATSPRSLRPRALAAGPAGGGTVQGETASPGAAAPAKSISPVPEYNIAPEISFLAKNFVNEFSRYLDHDHEVQRGELDAIEMENDQGAATDHKGMEKRALDGALNRPRFDGDAAGTGADERSVPLKGPGVDQSGPVEKGGADDAEFPADGDSEPMKDLMKPVKNAPGFPGASKRRTFLSRPLDVREAKRNRGAPPGDGTACDLSREDIQGWMRDVLA